MDNCPASDPVKASPGERASTTAPATEVSGVVTEAKLFVSAGLHVIAVADTSQGASSSGLVTIATLVVVARVVPAATRTTTGI